MDRTVFFDRVRARPFGGALSQSAVDGLSALIAAFDTYGDGDDRKLAYVLATAFHECDRFRTMEEYASGSAYEGRKDLGNTEAGDGRKFKGRGFVQLTGRANYADWSKRLDMDLLANPGLVKQRDIAARICVEGMMLGTFTGHGLARYITDDRADYDGARRTVNGTDRAALISGYARQFESALKASRAAAPDPIVNPEQTMTEKPLTPIEQMNKPVAGAVIGSAVTMPAGAVVAILMSSAGWLPEAWMEGTPAIAFGIATGWVCTQVGNFIGAYRARDKRFTAEVSG